MAAIHERLINRALGLANLRLSRVDSVRSATRNMRFGPYTITASETSTLPQAYQEYPDFNSAIGRAARNVLTKYPKAVGIDVGANAGDTIAIIKCYADMPILAVEGDDELFHLLASNMKQFKNIHLAKVFVGEAEADVPMQLSKVGWNTTLVPAQPGSGKPISITTLDRLIQDRPELANVKFLKVDAEGFDLRILRGAAKILGSSHPVVHFEYNLENINALNESGMKIFPFLQSLGFHRVMFSDARGQFLLATSFDQIELIQDLHDYTEIGQSGVVYYDICAFHSDDDDLAEQCIAQERVRRLGIKA